MAVPLIDFSHYASSSGCRKRCYTELAVSSPAVAETLLILIAPTHEGLARLSGLETTRMVEPPKVVTNPSTNQARRSLALSV